MYTRLENHYDLSYSRPRDLRVPLKPIKHQSTKLSRGSRRVLSCWASIMLRVVFEIEIEKQFQFSPQFHFALLWQIKFRLCRQVSMDWEIFHRMSERLTSLVIMEARLRASLMSLGTILLWYSRGYLGSPMMPRDSTLSDGCYAWSL